MGIENENSIPGGTKDFKAPDVTAIQETGIGSGNVVDTETPKEEADTQLQQESQTEQAKLDKAVLREFNAQWGNEAQFDYRSFNTITSRDLNTILDALSRGQSSPDAQKAVGVLRGITEKRLDQLSGGNKENETSDQLFDRMGTETYKGNVAAMRRMQEIGILNGLENRIAQVQQSIEDYERAKEVRRRIG
ncbi:MAG: hypothetical protein V1668_02855 [Patescibacteria group bacterium]